MRTLFIIINFLSCLCFSQNIKEELLNINKAFLKNTDVAVQTVTKAYTAGNTIAQKESKIELYRLNNNSLTKYDFTEIMVNNSYKISVNEKNKIIIISKIAGNKTNSKQSFSKFNDDAFNLAIDTALTVYKEVKIQSIDNLTHELLFVFKNGMYDQIKVAYDKTTYQVKTYHVKLNTNHSSLKGQKVTNYIITYNYLSNDVLKKIKFDEKQYVVIDKDKIVPSKKYTGFTIVNNIKKR